MNAVERPESVGTRPGLLRGKSSLRPLRIPEHLVLQQAPDAVCSVSLGIRNDFIRPQTACGLSLVGGWPRKRLLPVAQQPCRASLQAPLPLHRRCKPARAAGQACWRGGRREGPDRHHGCPPRPATQEVVSVTETDLRLQAVCVIRPVVCKPGLQRCLMGLWHGDGGTIKENKAKVHGG